MKKLVLFITVCLCFIVFDVKASSPDIYIDGTKTAIKGEIIDGRTFVSLKDLCAEINCKFGYKNKEDKANKLVTIYANLDRQVVDEITASTALIEIQYKINSDVYQPYVTVEFEDLKNRFALKPIREVKSVVKGGVDQIPYFGTQGSGDLYVPIRFIANGLGRKVEWNGATRSVYISVAKPENYDHLLVESKLDFGDEVVSGSDKNSLEVGKCLTTIAEEKNIVSNNSTLLSFVGNNTEKKSDGTYQISQLYTESKNKEFYGSFAKICSLKSSDEITKVVSISTPNYYPYIKVHDLTTEETTKEETSTEVAEVEETKNLINVPVDSRPVSRSKFSHLAVSAGYNYLEVTDGITDYVNNDINNSWVIGNSALTRNQTANLVSQNNNSDTTVIINTSSYLFGGLGATRSPLLYQDISALSELENLIKTYNQPTYYVTAVLPRVLPEQRLDDWSWPIKVGGLNYYINGANNESYKITYPEALVEWNYLKYMNEATNSYDSWPTGVKTFYNNFFKWYVDQGGESTTWEYQTYNSNVVKPWEYDQMYQQFYEIFKRLNSLQKETDIELVILTDDYELPSFIAANKNKYDWIVKDTDGEAIKYSAAYSVLQKIEKEFTENYNSKTNLVYGVDEINQMILARDLVKNGGSTINLDVNYSYNGLKNFVGYYDRSTVKEQISEISNFINYYGGNKTTDVSMHLVRSNPTYVNNADNIVKQVYNLANKQQAVMLTDLTDINVRKYFTEKMLTKDNPFQIPYYGGWNTVANAVGISLANIAVYSDLKADIDLCVSEKRCGDTLTSSLEQRLIAYDKNRMVNILEDGVYSGFVKANLASYSNNLDLNHYQVLNKLTNPNQPLKINKYTYYYDSSSAFAYNPWPRTFEVQVDVTLGNLVYK